MLARLISSTYNLRTYPPLKLRQPVTLFAPRITVCDTDLWPNIRFSGTFGHFWKSNLVFLNSEKKSTKITDKAEVISIYILFYFLNLVPNKVSLQWREIRIAAPAFLIKDNMPSFEYRV